MELIAEPLPPDLTLDSPRIRLGRTTERSRNVSMTRATKAG